MLQLTVYSLASVFGVLGVQGQNNLIPPVLVTCPPLESLGGEGGVWNCIPETTPWFPVQVGTECTFSCNGTDTHNHYRCRENGHWTPNPEHEHCQGGNPTTPTTTTRTTPTTTPTTTSTTVTTATTITTHTTTTAHSSSTTSPSTPSTTSGYNRCPFRAESRNGTVPAREGSGTVPAREGSGTVPAREGSGAGTRSLFCSEDLCPAVYIESSGAAREHYPDSIGCFNYEGSLMGDEYPNYVNEKGLYLTPHGHSNPVLGFTIWVVSGKILDTEGNIRNAAHDDIYCPYDMLDGWEYWDSKTNSWVPDPTLRVTCVHSVN